MRQMIRLLFTLFAVLCVAPAQIGGKAGIGGIAGMGGAGSTTWTLIQHPHNFTCTGSGTGSTQIIPCTVTLTSNTVAGDLLIMLSSFVSDATVGPTFSSASGDSTWTHCPAQLTKALQTSGYAQAVDCAYILSATGGASTATYSWTNTIVSAQFWSSDVEFLEIRRSTGAATFDACTSGGGCITSVTGTTARVGPACTLTGASDYVAQWISESQTIVSISGAAYINPFDLDNGDVDGGFAGALNQSSAPAQTWTTSGDTSADAAAMACVAFK